MSNRHTGKIFIHSIAIAACSALGATALTCVFTQIVLPRSNQLESQTTLTIKGETKKTLDVTLYDINPGTKKSYTINLEKENMSSYNVSLSFFKNESVGNLDRFLDISISANQFSIHEPLKDVLDNKKSYDLGKGVESILVAFSMPSDIGNEAQKIKTIFQMELEVKRS